MSTSEIDALRAAAQPLTGAPSDYDALLELIGDARFVLLGEASHGTHEFYRARTQITQRLIAERGFCALAVEADWPDAYRVNRYVRADRSTEDATAEAALRDFQRFPQWMWRNADVLDLVGWLRTHNESQPPHLQAGFYGLDLYSLYGSIDAVISYLDKTDPEAAARARQRYGCFEEFEKDVQAYGYAAATRMVESCEEDVVAQLLELQTTTAQREGAVLADDERFFAEQNARVAQNAEAYYRAMFRGRDDSWNLRDTHMADTLDALSAHLTRVRRPAKIVVWAHNSHLGDARATQMTERGELNLGQLTRGRHGGETVIVGFTTYTGTVTAATDWDEPAQRKRVRPALPESHEAQLHATGIPRFFLPVRQLAAELKAPRLERFIGVIYRPETERWSHYYEAHLPHQFDALLHFDESRALGPLERTPRWDKGEGDLPQTFPSAA